MLGTTLESDIWYPVTMGDAPPPLERVVGMLWLKGMCEGKQHTSRFVTIEPILGFEPAKFLDYLRMMAPDFVNIGADSKGHGLPEPTAVGVNALICGLKVLGIEIRQKSNLSRLLSPS
jgi:hypothetical protein